MRIQSLYPGIALPGGVVCLEVEQPPEQKNLDIRVGGVRAEILGVSSSLVTIRVPAGAGDDITVTGFPEVQARLKVGRVLAEEIHSVSNPVVDSFGNIYVTFSGPRGEKVPFSVFVVLPGGRREPFLADITNPTGLAIGPDECLYISSRHTGTAYRSTFDKQVEKYVEGLGVATGIAFDSKGNLLVGDRSGWVRKVGADLTVTTLCELEPSVSAYHLVIDSSDHLYVTAPTLATRDAIYRVSPSGEVEVFFRGFGRPQGMAMDADGNMQVAASFRGRKGIFTLRNGEPRWTISGPMLVGLAYSPDRKKVYLTDNHTLYEVEL